MVNRLVLNLSDAVSAREDSEFRTRTGLEPPTFAAGPVLGNIGGSLRTFPDDLDDELLIFECEWVATDEAESTTESLSTNEAENLNSINKFSPTCDTAGAERV